MAREEHAGLRSPVADEALRGGLPERSVRANLVSRQAMVMTTTVDPTAPIRRLYFEDPAAPTATLVVPSVFVAVRWRGGRLLLVRRCDDGTWELPGGRVEVGENAAAAAVRATAAEAGVQVLVTAIGGLFTDPGLVVRAPDGEVQQPFVVLFRARAIGGEPRGDAKETSAAAWVAVSELGGLAIQPPVRTWIAQALSFDVLPSLA